MKVLNELKMFKPFYLICPIFPKPKLKAVTENDESNMTPKPVTVPSVT